MLDGTGKQFISTPPASGGVAVVQITSTRTSAVYPPAPTPAASERASTRHGTVCVVRPVRSGRFRGAGSIPGLPSPGRRRLHPKASNSITASRKTSSCSLRSGAGAFKTVSRSTNQLGSDFGGVGCRVIERFRCWLIPPKPELEREPGVGDGGAVGNGWRVKSGISKDSGGGSDNRSAAMLPVMVPVASPFKVFLQQIDIYGFIFAALHNFSSNFVVTH